ncbi:23S rRNA (uracil(1939)-C(5))-methyltransferase RlmD [Paenibacillus antri]|uniref:23S rRNA (Uracil(1939)-C(5))-methyltransferase RlmD n=1 Tax=Paenibacillus antri TaxID=2582848 RepID=A0A5R9GGE5_9BACL|nr:23S rRNA (uracil(1939)-C(5))-methyltransferase RlmD [Paenibacillus antri]TLS51793.1 23S rRNA (uracil(1939)-C(5))-methyltransferase RlmD [Paenibacillus antri]
MRTKKFAAAKRRKTTTASSKPAGDAARRELPVALHDVIELDIVGLAHEGEGVGRFGGFTLFVPGALPGERVRARVAELRKNFGRAELLEVLAASPDRVAAPCAVYARCGGCQLQHFAYEAQLRWKRQLVVDALERIGKLRVAPSSAAPGVPFQGDSLSSGSPEGEVSSGASFQGDSLSSGYGFGGIVVHPVLGMDDPWRYRNKAQVPIGFDLEEGGLVGGFYEQGSHRIVSTDACLIQHERNDDAVLATKRIARELGIEAYDEKSRSGWLRHVVAKVSFATGEMMLVLVGTTRVVDGLDALVARLRDELPHVVSICLNVNPDQTSAVFGRETATLWGADVIFDSIGGIRFAISARSFYQVNPVQTERLYGKALEYAALEGGETVIDAYCGIGTISLFLARSARQVYGVELIPDAVEDARANARLNDIDNADFEVGRAEVVLPAWREQGIDADVIVVDPPRKGCDPALLDTLVAMRPERIVYVSCNPATLARDLAALEAGGFATLEVQPVDMFPHTGHVECVALVIRNETEDQKPL